MTFALDPSTTIFNIGLLYTLMPLAVWTVLRGRHDPGSTALWCGGALLSGMSYLLFGMRASLPVLVSLHVGNLIGFAGYALRWSALRRERGVGADKRLVVGVVLLSSLLYAVFASLGEKVRLLFAVFILVLSSAALAWEARRLARSSGSRSANMVALTYGLLAATSVVRLLVLLGERGEPTASDFTADRYLLLFAGVVSALWGNIGYLGLAMENAQRLESARRAELAAATARSEQAERQAEALKALSDERQELLRVISHEVRQPLHNAQAVLQGVDGALHTELAEGEAAAARVARARSVLRQITASLDNTLAVSTLLVESRPAPLRDTDIAMLLELCLGDLPPAGRSRVQIVHPADLRTAAMDVGLMRLALRNLLNNALAYSTPGAVVLLRVVDSDVPLALLLEVADTGPAIGPDLLPRLFERGTRGRHDLPGQGLGLYIVQLAMRRQGGSVAVQAASTGNTFTLVLPQGLEPR
jgi:signal transduction histidine kinase